MGLKGQKSPLIQQRSSPYQDSFFILTRPHQECFSHTTKVRGGTGIGHRARSFHSGHHRGCTLSLLLPPSSACQHCLCLPMIRRFSLSRLSALEGSFVDLPLRIFRYVSSLITQLLRLSLQSPLLLLFYAIQRVIRSSYSILVFAKTSRIFRSLSRSGTMRSIPQYLRMFLIPSP